MGGIRDFPQSFVGRGVLGLCPLSRFCFGSRAWAAVMQIDAPCGLAMGYVLVSRGCLGDVR